jgi:hypothetical protein
MDNHNSQEKKRRRLIRKLRRDAIKLDDAFKAFDATARKLGPVVDFSANVIATGHHIHNLLVISMLTGGAKEWRNS